MEALIDQVHSGTPELPQVHPDGQPWGCGGHGGEERDNKDCELHDCMVSVKIVCVISLVDAEQCVGKNWSDDDNVLRKLRVCRSLYA
jgi:hypothetical protein